MLNRLELCRGHRAAHAAPRAGRARARGWLFLTLGILSFVVVLSLALGLRDALAGKWPHAGLVVVTYEPEARPVEAPNPSPSQAPSHGREGDLSVSQVRALISEQEMAGEREKPAEVKRAER